MQSDTEFEFSQRKAENVEVGQSWAWGQLPTQKENNGKEEDEGTPAKLLPIILTLGLVMLSVINFSNISFHFHPNLMQSPKSKQLGTDWQLFKTLLFASLFKLLMPGKT